MSRRHERIRQRERRVLAWSLALAAFAHLAVLVWWPGIRFAFETDDDIRLAGPSEGTPVFVDLLFGPTEIVGPDGGTFHEPPEHVLAADRVLRLPTECTALAEEGRTPTSGRVRLSIDTNGYTELRGLVGSTGDPCGDEVITAAADALRYRWLPNDRFPAPVDVIQPVTLTNAER